MTSFISFLEVNHFSESQNVQYSEMHGNLKNIFFGWGDSLIKLENMCHPVFKIGGLSELNELKKRGLFRAYTTEKAGALRADQTLKMGAFRAGNAKIIFHITL